MKDAQELVGKVFTNGRTCSYYLTIYLLIRNVVDVLAIDDGDSSEGPVHIIGA